MFTFFSPKKCEKKKTKKNAAEFPHSFAWFRRNSLFLIKKSSRKKNTKTVLPIIWVSRSIQWMLQVFPAVFGGTCQWKTTPMGIQTAPVTSWCRCHKRAVWGMRTPGQKAIQLLSFDLPNSHHPNHQSTSQVFLTKKTLKALSTPLHLGSHEKTVPLFPQSKEVFFTGLDKFHPHSAMMILPMT